MTAEEKAWCVLSGARGIGPKTLWSIADYLVTEHRSATWLLEHPAAIETAANGRASRIELSELTIEQPDEAHESEDNRVTILHPLHPDFPPQIKTHKDSFLLPAILYVRGNVGIFSKPSVSIVGARNAGDPALMAADQLASQLSKKGINVTSGYAKGIDTAAHLAALRDGGTTSIVLSEGINHFRPKRELQGYFSSDNTLVVSQFEPNAKWASHFAMTRNKLVCALARVVVIIVSGPERDRDGRMSGTFDAGLTALKMGIPVFVVTPSYFDDEPAGNSELLVKGCREWQPTEGAQPIISAVEGATIRASERGTTNKRSKSEQLGLFDRPE